MWKDFFYFTRAERQGILILAVLCILVFVAGWLIPVKENTAKNDTEKFKKEYAGFMSSIREKEQKIYSHNNRFQPPRTVRLTTFDPNITDSVGFLDLGLPAWMAKNIHAGIRSVPMASASAVYSGTSKETFTWLCAARL